MPPNEGLLRPLTGLLRRNAAFRRVWIGQVVSESGDHFNNIAVFSLAMAGESPVWVLSNVLVCRALGSIAAAPVAGVALDRSNPAGLMILSDVVRSAIALGFIALLVYPSTVTLYVLSATLTASSPFFTAGRAALLPSIVDRSDLHRAASLTQWTQWAALTIGALAGGTAVALVGFLPAFVVNSLSFLVSAWCVAPLAGNGWLRPTGWRHSPRGLHQGWREYRDGLTYLWHLPLGRAIAVAYVGWAAGGGAAQILFTVFAERVFERGAAGVGAMFTAAGMGLLIGGACGYALGRNATFDRTKAIALVCFVVHTAGYAIFSETRVYWVALLGVLLSRAATGTVVVLHYSQLTRYLDVAYRGRVFATLESLSWSTMLISMIGASVLLTRYPPRAVARVAVIATFMTIPVWLYLTLSGLLPEPADNGADDSRAHERVIGDALR